MNETNNKELEKMLTKMGKRELMILIWVIRFIWVKSKIKNAIRKYFPLDPMVIRKKTA